MEKNDRFEKVPSVSTTTHDAAATGPTTKRSTRAYYVKNERFTSPSTRSILSYCARCTRKTTTMATAYYCAYKTDDDNDNIISHSYIIQSIIPYGF